MGYVLNNDKEFNFNDYYENSPYSKVFSITREQVRGVKKLIRVFIG
jgi:hypothetical protein